MRRPAFKVDPSHKNKARDSETESKSNKKISEDFMPSTLRKMLSMKKGKRKESAEGASGSKMTMDHSKSSSEALHDKKIRTDTIDKKDRNSNQIDKNVSSKQSEAKRKKKEFLKAKEKKKLKKNQESSHGKAIGKANNVAFGEQAEQPLESSLKRKHWVEGSNSQTVGIRPRTSVPKLDSKILAAFYKNSGGSGKAGGGRATMQSLKALLCQKEGENSA